MGCLVPVGNTGPDPALAGLGGPGRRRRLDGLHPAPWDDHGHSCPPARFGRVAVNGTAALAIRLRGFRPVAVPFPGHFDRYEVAIRGRRLGQVVGGPLV